MNAAIHHVVFVVDIISIRILIIVSLLLYSGCPRVER